MAFIGSAVHCMPLTPYLYLSMLPDARQRKVLVHACAALRQGILELHEHYTSAKGPSQQDAVPYTLFEDQRYVCATKLHVLCTGLDSLLCCLGIVPSCTTLTCMNVTHAVRGARTLVSLL